MFKDFNGYIQRGILLEAHIRYEGHQLSKYNKMGDTEETKRQFIEEECERIALCGYEYAEHLAEIESNMFYTYPFKKDRLYYIKQRAKDYSKKLDNDFIELARSTKLIKGFDK